MQLTDIVESGQFDFINEGRTPSFKLSFHGSGDTASKFVWDPEDVHDFAMAVQFYEKGEGERNAEIFRHSIKVSEFIFVSLIQSFNHTHSLSQNSTTFLEMVLLC